MTTEETPSATEEAQSATDKSQSTTKETPSATGETPSAAEETPLSSEDEFNTELKALLIRAYDAGIDVEGGWECRNGGEHPDWDVIVTEVRKNEGSE